MTHPSVLSSVPTLRLSALVPSPQVASQTVLPADFHTAVTEKLEAQWLLSDDPALREVLQQISQAFRDDPEACVPHGVKLPGDSTPFDRNEVSAFLDQLKQQRLYQMDRALSGHFTKSLPECAQPAERAAIATGRIQALAQMRTNAADHPFLQTCLDEHIAASRQQQAAADRAIFAARLPAATAALRDRIATLEATQRNVESKSRTNLLDTLQQAVAARLVDNTAQITRLKEMLNASEEHQIEVMERRDETGQQLSETLALQKAILSALSTALKQGATIREVPEMLPEIMKTDLALLGTLQTRLETLLAAIPGPARERVDLNGMQDTLPDAVGQKQREELRQLTQTLSADRDAHRALEKAARERSVMGDVALRIRRLFGYRGDEKTRSQYRAALHKSSAALHLQEQQLAQRTQQVEKRETQYRMVQDGVRLNAQEMALREQLLQTLTNYQQTLEDEYLRQQQTLNDEYDVFRVNLIDGEEVIINQRNDLESRNRELTRLMAGDPLGAANFHILCDRLAGSPVLSTLHTQHARVEAGPPREYLEALSSLKELYTQCNVLRNTLGLPLDLDCEADIAALRPQLAPYGIDTPPVPSEISQQIAQASALFALRCVEKVLAHPLTRLEQEAQVLTPRVMEMLAELETRTLPSPREAEEEVISPRQCRVREHIQGLRRILSHEHREALNCALDFNAQFYHPKEGLYIDRQYEHGTCLMHTWNNMLAYLTDNREMQLTPWRMEKLIQTTLIRHAHQQLSDLLNAGEKLARPLKLTAVENSLKQLLRSPRLVNPCRLEGYGQRGHVMVYKDMKPENIKSSYLLSGSIRVFELAGLDGHTCTDYVFEATQPPDHQTRILNELAEKNYDAIEVVFSGQQQPAHALALVKQGEQYLLIDSHHADPLTLTLPSLMTFITTGQTFPALLTQQLQARNYQDYSVLHLCSGIYKGDTVYGTYN